MAKATAHPSQPEAESNELDLYMVGLPLATYRALSDAAAARGLTFAQGLAQAIGDFIQRAASDGGDHDV